MDNYRQRVLSGVGWTGFNQVGLQAVWFVISVILARLLSPGQFGLLGMVTVITGFAGMFAGMGLDAALVQKESIRQDHLSSVFWVNVGAGFALTTLFMLCSPLLAAFYGEAILRPLTMVVATTFAIGSLQVVQSALMTRALDFRRLSIIGLASTGVSGASAIIMAWLGLGVWSLAFQRVIASAVNALLVWRSSTWRPQFQFNRTFVRGIIGFSGNLTATRALNYWVRNLDNLLIGRVLGTGALGIYSRAYGLMMFPVTNISSAISTVMFPSLCIIQKDKERVKGMYLRLTRSVALVSFPLMLGLLFCAENFVIGIFGRQWAEAIPIVQIFSVSGIVQSIVALSGNLFLCQGRADLAFRIGLFLKLVPIAGIIIGLKWGIIGVAIGLVVASFINAYPNLFFAGRLVSLSVSEIVRSVSGSCICGLTMAGAVGGLGLSLPSEWSHGARLAVQVPFGLIIYWALIHIFRLKAYAEALELFREYVKRS